MEFLSKHYEKLILAFCLICLFFGIISVGLSDKSTTDALHKEEETAKRDVAKGDMIEKKGAAEYGIGKFLNDPRKILNILGDDGAPSPKGSLIEPNKLILCVNEKCNHLISLFANKCPFCGTEQPEMGKETAAGDDTDSDGIPDKVEIASKFLNYRDPTDARLDYDNDGFLNIEEFEQGTKMDDPDDFPKLANLLRTVKVFKTEVQLSLVDIERNNSDDDKKWDIIVMAFDPRQRKIRRMTRQLGDEVGGFTIHKAGFEGEGSMALPYIVVSSKNAPTDMYTIKKGRKTYHKNLMVRMLYLTTRDRNYAQMLFRRSVVVCRVGDEFPLVKNKTNARLTEYYKVLDANETENTIKVGLLKESKGQVEKEFTLRLFNMENDFIDNRRGGMMDDMMGPGMEAAPGMGPEVGPGMNPGRGRNRRGGMMP